MMVEWQEPPPRQRKGRLNSRWFRFVTELQEQPGRWAVAKTGDVYTSFSSLRHNLYCRGCDVEQHTNDDGTVTLYARWPQDIT